MIQTERLYKRFGNLTALDDISLTCRSGECIALMGPNGSGKTTLIKSILGMVVPDSGTVQVKGKNIKGDWHYRSSIGYMPQIGSYPYHMTIGQIFDMVKDLRRVQTADTDNELLEGFGLHHILQKRMGTLSGGTTQKVSASLACMFPSEILILDEPTSGLDPIASELFKNRIRKEKERGKLILITSHILSDLDDLVSEIVYLQDGSLKFHKSYKQLKEDTGEENLSKAIAAVMKNNSSNRN